MAIINVAIFFLTVVIWRVVGGGRGVPDALYVAMPAFAVMEALPLYWRRSRPLPVAVAVLVLFVVRELVALRLGSEMEEGSGSGVSLLVALYAVGAYAERRAAWVGLAVSIVTLGLMEGFTADPAASPVAIAVGVVLQPAFGALLPWGIGYLVRANRGLAAEREGRLLQARDLEAERASRAMAEERGRIARELHDVIAHHVGVMVIQAGAGQRVLDRDPERARAAFRAIQDAGRAALTAMPAVLGALRGDARPGLAPLPTLRDVDALVEQVEAAGLTVVLETRGAPRPLPAGVELATYRVLQEALTNVLKHAGPVRAAVTLSYGRDVLEVAVRDSGPQGAPPAPVAGAAGHGLLGMRERIELLGGTLHAGLLAAGGFEVVACLPLASAPTPTIREGVS